MAKKSLYPYLSGHISLLESYGADANYLQDINDKTESILNHTHRLMVSDLDSIFYSLFGTSIIHTQTQKGRYVVHKYTDLHKVFTIKLELGLNTYAHNNNSLNIHGIRRIISVQSPIPKSKAIYVSVAQPAVAPRFNIMLGNLQSIDTLHAYYMQASLDGRYVHKLKTMLNEQIHVIDCISKLINANINYTEIP